jgi:hypothetical protein
LPAAHTVPVAAFSQPAKQAKHSST